MTDASPLTAIVVMDGPRGPVLSPFFGKSDGILLIDGDGRPHRLEKNAERTSQNLCTLIMRSQSDRLICGFISPAERRQLMAAGVDVRLGSATFSLDDLVRYFRDLPKA